MPGKGTKRKQRDDDEEKPKSKKRKLTLEEKVTGFMTGQFNDGNDQERGAIYGYQTKIAEYVGEGYWKDPLEKKHWIDAERKLVDCNIPQRYPAQQRFEQVMGLKTKFSKEFCMNVFMYFTPRERLTMLMKFWRVWRDHFKNEKLPWRWVIAEANSWQTNQSFYPSILKQIEASPYLLLSRSVFEKYRAINPRITYAGKITTAAIFYWFSWCLDECVTCKHQTCERHLRLKHPTS
jgi:hypothetical protein